MQDCFVLNEAVWECCFYLPSLLFQNYCFLRITECQGLEGTSSPIPCPQFFCLSEEKRLLEKTLFEETVNSSETIAVSGISYLDLDIHLWF